MRSLHCCSLLPLGYGRLTLGVAMQTVKLEHNKRENRVRDRREREMEKKKRKKQREVEGSLAELTACVFCCIISSWWL